MIEKAGKECHGDVADDVAACDAKGDADAACPAGKDRNADAAKQYVDELAQAAELRAQEDPREEDRKGRKRNRNFSG